MSICGVCGNDIPRGKKYIGERYKGVNFCSVECYNKYLASKDQGYTELTDYINEQWGGEVNWAMVTRQIKLLKKDGYTYKKIKNVIKHAIEHEHHCVNVEYSLNQIFPKYVESYERWEAQVKTNRILAKSMPEDIIEIKSPHKNIVRIKQEEW